MKKTIFLSVCVSVCLCCSCSNKLRTDFIIDGIFEGPDSINDDSLFHMEIKKITEVEYHQAYGKNVVKDLVKEGYYEISLFSKKNNEDVITNYTFYNLKDAFNGEKGTKMFYEDDNRSCFRPFTTSNNKPLEREKCYYYVAFYTTDNLCTASSYLTPIIVE